MLLVSALGLFLCFLVPGSSHLVPLLLSFSPLGVFCPFLGGFSDISRSISSWGGVFSSFSLPVFPAVTAFSSFPFPLPLVHSFLPSLGDPSGYVSFCASSCASSFLFVSFPSFFPLSLSLSVSSFSCPLSFSGLFLFFAFGFFGFRIQGFPFGPVVVTRLCVPILVLVLLILVFVVLGLVFLFFWSFVRFPPCFQLGVRALGVLSLFIAFLRMWSHLLLSCTCVLLNVLTPL